MDIYNICTKDVVVVDRHVGISEATSLMRARHVGDLVIVEGEAPIGILTDRDIIIKALAKNVNIEQIVVGDIMSYELVTVNKNDSIMKVIDVMSHEGVRRAPIIDNSGKLVGVISLDDIIELLASALSKASDIIKRERIMEQTMLAEVLSDYEEV